MIVVGNLTVGGTGKTPLVIGLSEALARAGFSPGVICRGYGGSSDAWPQRVTGTSPPAVVGDEAVLLARRCPSPVAAGPDRAAAAALLHDAGCDVIVSDDGLQHYAMARDLELVVIDAVREHGNGHVLPAGPLREHISRLNEVDWVVSNGGPKPGRYTMKLQPAAAVTLESPGTTKPLSAFRGEPVHAVCGVGNPERFFGTLLEQGIEFTRHAFPDHHPFSAADLDFGDNLPILMTEKDAVKCERLKHGNAWYVPVKAELDDVLVEAVISRLKSIVKSKYNPPEPGPANQ